MSARQGGVLSKLTMRSRPVQVLMALLVSSGVVIATGAILSSITKTQTVTATAVFLDANCDSVDQVDEQFASVALAQPKSFCLGVKNTATSELQVHVHMIAACPTSGNASVSDGPGQGDDLLGPDQRSACANELSGPSKLISGGASAFWSYNASYLLVAGAYTWTFAASQG